MNSASSTTCAMLSAYGFRLIKGKGEDEMKNYTVKVIRNTIDVGYITIKANSAAEAVRKYYYPIAGVEDIVFDDEIDWEETEMEYTATAEED